MSFPKRLKRVFIASGVITGILMLGGVLSGLYLEGTSTRIECDVEGEKKEFAIRGKNLIMGRAVITCEEKSGERLCGPLTKSSIPVYLYITPDLSAMYFAPKVEASREKCHEMGLGYNPTFGTCISMDGKLECTKRKTF